MSKVAVFNTRIAGGGAERFSVLLSGGLADAGYETTLLTGSPEQGEYNVSSSVERIVLIDNHFGGGRDLFNWSHALKAFLNERNIDICIAVGIVPSLVSCLVAGKVRAKTVVCERNAPKQDLLSWQTKVARFLLYRRADFFVFQTLGAKSFYSKAIQDRSAVIPNPVVSNLPTWNSRNRHEIAAVGRLSPQKNYPIMLGAFQRVHEQYPDWNLRIFGEGPCRGDYERITNELGIADAVTFEGFRSDVHERIAECDIFLMTSDFEGMPNSLLEAMAIGMPCISTDCPAGGPAMLIEHEVNGILCQVGDEDSVAKAIGTVICSDSLRVKLAKNAFESREQYSLDRIMKRWNSLIASLTN